ncbi:hypothetical protein Shyhy02_38630 [Streptomyces hygroscopicus subsp. hygroscopicus]|nr:hypothetical protein Shyhy02_38630 [Streptomyces hygroscopicus subsp. hygroscopicus]
MYRSDGAWASTSPGYAGRGMASPEQFTMPAQDRVGADQEQKVPQSVFGEVVEQAGDLLVVVPEALHVRP